MAPISQAKRLGPPDVKPISRGGYVYTVPHWATENGTGQNGGYIRVLNAKTGLEVWGVQLYKTKYDAEMETDVQDVFIKSIKINLFGRKLTAVDELRRKYQLDLKTRAVERLK